jgi:hypothetical protein
VGRQSAGNMLAMGRCSCSFVVCVGVESRWVAKCGCCGRSLCKGVEVEYRERDSCFNDCVCIE